MHVSFIPSLRMLYVGRKEFPSLTYYNPAETMQGQKEGYSCMVSYLGPDMHSHTT